MGRKPGPKALPANVVEMRGNRSQLTAAELEERRRSTPEPAPVAPRMPAGLSPDERECWLQHAKELEHLGLLTKLDAGSFLLVCQAYGMAKAARREMLPRTKTGRPDRRSSTPQILVPDHHGGFRRHPAFIVWNQAVQTYARLCADFGLTPLSRVGLRPGAFVPPAGEPDEDDDGDLYDHLGG